MANYRAVASGNWSAGATWGGGAVPPNAAGHSIYSNTFTVTVDTNVDVALVTNAANAGTFVGGGTAASGGTFPLSNGVTMTSSITASTASTNCVSFSGTSPNTATIVGTVTGGGSTAIGVANVSTGTLIINSAGTNTGRAFSNTSTGTLTITGNCTASGGGGSTPLLTNSAGGVVNLTGNLVGGTGGGSSGINNTSNGAINIIGNVSGGTAAVGVSNTSTGIVTIVGDVTATTQNAISSTSATVRISGSFIYAIDGTIPVSAPRMILNTTPALAKTRYALNGAGTYVDMFTTDNSFGQASVSDVRFGTVYASGTLTGVAYIPSASSVAFGVPVDNTTGTATLTAADVRAAIGMASANLDTQLAAIPTAITNADAVRTNLALELGRIDATISSRSTLTAANVRTELAPELTEITEVHAIHGLDIANALTVTPTSRTSGAITQTITGDGTTNTVVTRV